MVSARGVARGGWLPKIFVGRERVPDPAPKNLSGGSATPPSPLYTPGPLMCNSLAVYQMNFLHLYLPPGESTAKFGCGQRSHH